MTNAIDNPAVVIMTWIILPRCCFNQYHYHPSDNTGVSPAELLLGRKPKSQLDLNNSRVRPWQESKIQCYGKNHVIEPAKAEAGHSTATADSPQLLAHLQWHNQHYPQPVYQERNPQNWYQSEKTNHLEQENNCGIKRKHSVWGSKLCRM